jgi:hypothetical protein
MRLPMTPNPTKPRFAVNPSLLPTLSDCDDHLLTDPMKIAAMRKLLPPEYRNRFDPILRPGNMFDIDHTISRLLGSMYPKIAG